MSILKRKGIVRVRAGTALVARGFRRKVAALFAIIVAALGAAYLRLPEHQISSAAPIAANPTSDAWRKPQARTLTSKFAAPRPQIQKPAPLTQYSHGDTAPQIL